MAENIENNGCSQRDSAEHEGYVKARRSFNLIWKERDSAQPKLLEAILHKDNFNRAYKRVKANKGAPGVDGMTIEEALPYLKEHQQELTTRIYRGKYTPSRVRRVEIPKPDGGVRKLGIPTVIDRTLQQAITQQLVPIYESLFADGSYGYRPNRDTGGGSLRNGFWEWEEYFLAYVDCKTGELHKEEGRIAFPVTDTENLPYQFEDETIYRLKVREKVPEGVPNGALPIKNHFLIVEVLEKNVACPELEEILTEYRKPVVINDDVLGELTYDKQLKSFAKRISLSLIWVTSGGLFTAYLDDDLFFGHSIAVNGSPKKGLLSADIEG